jgi:hypothetical protein
MWPLAMQEKIEEELLSLARLKILYYVSVTP